MVGHRSSTPAILALAVRVVGIAGRLVPSALRSDWEREWRAELWHFYHSLEAQGLRSVSARASFVLRSTGSVFDALQLRLGDAQLWSESLSAVATRWGRHPGSVATALLVLSLGIAADALLIAFGHIMVEVPDSMWGSLTSRTRLVILGIAIACGVSLIVTSAAAAAQLLGCRDPSPDGHDRARAVETLLVAGVTGWIGRWFAAFGMRSMISPYSGAWLASGDPGAAVTSAWLVSWLCGLAVLTVLRGRPRWTAASSR